MRKKRLESVESRLARYVIANRVGFQRRFFLLTILSAAYLSLFFLTCGAAGDVAPRAAVVDGVGVDG